PFAGERLTRRGEEPRKVVARGVRAPAIEVEHGGWLLAPAGREREDERGLPHHRREREPVERRAVTIDDLHTQALAARRAERHLALADRCDGLAAEVTRAGELGVDAA